MWSMFDSPCITSLYITLWGSRANISRMLQSLPSLVMITRNDVANQRHIQVGTCNVAPILRVQLCTRLEFYSPISNGTMKYYCFER